MDSVPYFFYFRPPQSYFFLCRVTMFENHFGWTLCKNCPWNGEIIDEWELSLLLSWWNVHLWATRELFPDYPNLQHSGRDCLCWLSPSPHAESCWVRLQRRSKVEGYRTDLHWRSPCAGHGTAARGSRSKKWKGRGLIQTIGAFDSLLISCALLSPNKHTDLTC
jgi:hypothetical protein